MPRWSGNGSKGLRGAIKEHRPRMVQGCTVPTRRNLERHVPCHALEAVRTDYHCIVQAESLAAARLAYSAFLANWSEAAPKVAASLQEVGDELLTCYRFPHAQWKSLRTTNAIAHLHGEFRRRVKTQGALPTAHAAEWLPLALVMSGQIRLWRNRWLATAGATERGPSPDLAAPAGRLTGDPLHRVAANRGL